MSPFVVTATRSAPCIVCDDPTCTHTSEELSSRAVATLDEAQDAVAAVLVEHGERPGVAPAIPGHGGALSPLPDGTLIEVRPYRWVDLAACANVHWEDTPECRAEVLAAFNAQGVTA